MQGCKTSEKVPATIMGQPFPFDTEISASTRFDCVLSNDDCIQCCSSEELVTRNEELDAVVSKYDALPDAADFHIVVASCVQWHGVLQALRVIYDLDTLRRLEQLADIIRTNGLLGLHDDGLGVCPERRDSNGSAGNFHIVVQAEDLLQLPSDLHLFLGVAVLLELVDLRNDVEGQLVGKELGLRYSSILHPRREAILQLGHARSSGTAGRLVGRHQHLLQLVLLMDGPQRHGTHRGCAVRIGYERRIHLALPVDLRNHQWLVLVVPPCR
mmetsp:Transcript_97343/g.135260  ORF Transcript_97343/g.135260 Transcript_97343/m.135260 type:complete len:270 (+) Transcript_97343:130-939(+)